MKVQKVNPLYEQIYDNLKKAIISGELQPGERMVDAWFAEKLSVSRSPVREAFRKLEQDGLLINKDGNMLIYKPNVDDVADLFEVRAGLEGMAIYLTTTIITDQEIEELEKCIYRVRKAFVEKDLQEVVNQNTFFHEFIVNASKNKRLIDMMGNINNLTLLYRNNFFNYYYVDDSFIEEHIEIYEIIKSRNPDLASKKMRDHILHDLEQLKEKLNVQKRDQSEA